MKLTTKNGNVVILKGLIDDETRCKHYHNENDIIAIKFKCCNIYYPCYQCHIEFNDAGGSFDGSEIPTSDGDNSVTTEPHPIDRWNKHDLIDEPVILCGKCKKEMTFNEYSSLVCECGGQFNPGCKLHYDLYFDMK